MHEPESQREEAANAITHALGICASLVGGVLLITLAARSGDAWQIVSASVFGASLLLLYTASTLYHAVHSPRTRARLQVLDHCAIFVLIAGTYTPFTLISLRGGWGWSLFGVIWGLALCRGGVQNPLYRPLDQRLSTLIYVAMGWLVLIAAVPMISALSTSTLGWLTAGGLIYTAGTLLYHSQSIPYAHAIWHVFVLGGSTAHFIAVLSQILPSSPA